jgi:hypothetical protein
MDTTGIILEQKKESSAVWDSNKGFLFTGSTWGS